MSRTYNRISVYVVAHQDDWQLFMDPDISHDLLDANCKTIIIHTTAGDAGSDQLFWKAREKGAISSLLFRLSEKQKTRVHKIERVISGTRLSVFEIANCRFYFLRIPDGGMYGDGFELYRHQSLSKLRLKAIAEITTVDGLNTFNSFEEISILMDEILKYETGLHSEVEISMITLSFPEFNTSLSPQDHDDHLNTSLLLQQTSTYGLLKKYAFVHYDIQNSGADLEGLELFWKTGMFCVYHQAVVNHHGYSTIDESSQYRIWCQKNTLKREIT